MSGFASGGVVVQSTDYGKSRPGNIQDVLFHKGQLCDDLLRAEGTVLYKPGVKSIRVLRVLA